MNILGKNSKTSILSVESHKLCLEFEAAADLEKGQLVKLNAAGKIALWAKADGRNALLGVLIVPAKTGYYGTVATRGYALVNGLSAAAQATGLATVNGYDNATDYGDGTTGYNTVAISATDAEIIGWALDVAAGIGSPVRLLIRN